MAKFIKDKNVTPQIRRRLIYHYEYNWQRTQGGSPQNMFTYVYSVLRETLVTTMYEQTIRKVPGFDNVQKSVVRVIGKNLDEIYFLRGETIVKHDDIQEYIYFIYRGTVCIHSCKSFNLSFISYSGKIFFTSQIDVVSKSGEIITSMDSGLFGNISRKPFSLSSVSFVAKTNVDVLKLHSMTLFKALQVLIT